MSDKKSESPEGRFSPVGKSFEKQNKEQEKKSPIIESKIVQPTTPIFQEKENKNYKNTPSPLISKEMQGYKKGEIPVKYVKDTQNFRKNSANRRESPRYAEPVRKFSSREPQGEGNRRESPVVKFSSDELERNLSVERKLKMINGQSTPIKIAPTQVSEYYKNSPTVRPFVRGKGESKDDGEENKTAEINVERTEKFLNLDKGSAAKPPVRRK